MEIVVGFERRMAVCSGEANAPRNRERERVDSPRRNHSSTIAFAQLKTRCATRGDGISRRILQTPKTWGWTTTKCAASSAGTGTSRSCCWRWPILPGFAQRSGAPPFLRRPLGLPAPLLCFPWLFLKCATCSHGSSGPPLRLCPARWPGPGGVGIINVLPVITIPSDV
jgi:hypothetical protein